MPPPRANTLSETERQPLNVFLQDVPPPRQERSRPGALPTALHIPDRSAPRPRFTSPTGALPAPTGALPAPTGALPDRAPPPRQERSPTALHLPDRSAPLPPRSPTAALLYRRAPLPPRSPTAALPYRSAPLPPRSPTAALPYRSAPRGDVVVSFGRVPGRGVSGCIWRPRRHPRGGALPPSPP